MSQDKPGNGQSNPLDLVDDYVHGLLSEGDAARVERFCEEDEAGREALAAARERAEAMRSLPNVEASESLIRSTLENVDRSTARKVAFKRRFAGGLGLVTAIALLVVAGFHWHYAAMKPSPYDVRLLGQRELLSGSRVGLRVAVHNVEADAPVVGVPVRFALFRDEGAESIDLGEFETNELGLVEPVVQLPEWESGSYQLRIVAGTKTEEPLNETIELKRSWKLMLSTDKPVYKPGQRIRVRALALRRPDLKPVDEEAAVFEITDPKSNVIFRETKETSEFGITDTDCLLATEIIEGTYTISCTVGDTMSEATVEVEKYVLPKFQAVVSLDQPFYAPGDRVAGKLQADYFFGKPVAGADVEFVAEAEGGIGDRLAVVEAKTDEKGLATVEFDLPEAMVGLERHAGDAAFRLVAIVTDTGGQRRTVATSRVVTANPVHVEIVPEMGRLVAGVANKVYVFTNRADGKPIAASIAVKGRQKPIETSELGVAVVEIEPEGESVELDVTATSLANPEHVGRRTVRLEVGSIARDFVLRTDKAVYSGGETMTLQVLGGGVEPVFVDFVKDGQTILSKTIDVEKAKGAAKFDLPPDVFGTLRLCAYRFGADALPVMKLRTVHIGRASQLKITAELDHESYRPGEPARVDFRVIDPEGKPVPGALSLAAVDEAVFHVLKQRPGSEGTFFELERELLEPVYAIYGGWQPGMAPDVPLAERVEFEQALFARTTNVATPEFVGAGAVSPGDMELDDVDAMEVELGAPDMGVIEEVAPGGDPFAEPPPVRAGGGAETIVVAEADSPLTLVSETYTAKKEAVETAQRAGLKQMLVAWRWFVVWVVVAGAAVFAVFLPLAFLITAGVTSVVAVAVYAFWWRPMMLNAENIDALEMAVAERAAFGGAAAGEADMAFMEGEDEMFAFGDDGFDPTDAATAEEPGNAVAAQPVRVRRYFPETLYWQPELVTDDEGRASLTLPLADSITTWRLTASAVSGDGRLGGMEDGIRVFQPFFVDLDLPVALVRNDEVAVPAVVYNYLDEPQSVELELARADWFELLDAGDEATFQRLELGPGEVRSIHYRIRAKDVGNHRLQVTARAGQIADAVEREVAVDPDGLRVETVVNGTLDDPRTIELTVPENAIPGSIVGVVKMYPSGFSELVEGLDGILQRPYGCFEQTSSTTYPNILALQYLRESGQAAPEVEQKARQFIHLGYQRLLGFEVDGGGFDWFGNPPANVTLTAYGLMEFVDMAQVHDVDPKLIERTRDWLLSKRRPDGSWGAERGMLNDGLAGSVQRGKDLDLSTTAYVAWAVFRGYETSASQRTQAVLLKRRPDSIDDPYTLAVVCNALLALDPSGGSADPYLARLVGLRKSSEDGKQSWWELGDTAQTQFYGSGESGNVELTALATLALMEAKSDPAVTTTALRWLAAKKQGNGTWGSTQATVLALQALVRGTSAPLGENEAREFEVAVDGDVLRQWTVPADQATVVQQVDVSSSLATGVQQLGITEKTGTGTTFQVALRYHVPEEPVAPETEPLSIDLVFDKTDLAVHDSIVATATVRNNQDVVAPMVIADLPIPAGFTIDPVDLEELVASGDIAKYQVNVRSAVVYLRGLAPGEPLELVYRLQAKMPVKLSVPPAVVYEYYDPDVKGRGDVLNLVVRDPT